VVVDVAELAHKPMPAWKPGCADLERARDRVEALARPRRCGTRSRRTGEGRRRARIGALGRGRRVRKMRRISGSFWTAAPSSATIRLRAMRKLRPPLRSIASSSPAIRKSSRDRKLSRSKQATSTTRMPLHRSSPGTTRSSARLTRAGHQAPKDRRCTTSRSGEPHRSSRPPRQRRLNPTIQPHGGPADFR
jgi:hypothetical protein